MGMNQLGMMAGLQQKFSSKHHKPGLALSRGRLDWSGRGGLFDVIH
jgi:hypothetical protein